MKRKLSPLPYEAGECSSSGSRRPGHPHSTPWSCKRAKTKLTTHVTQYSTFCPRQYLHAPLLCRGALCRVSHQQSVCVCVFSSHSFWTSSSLDVPAGVTQEEGHTRFLIHLLSAVRALIFLARRIQPFLSLVDREVELCVLTI